MLTVVVAKCKENIDWIYDIQHPVIVYDKSMKPEPQFIPRPNIGREAETLLYYIITHYHNLPDAVIFLQGDPRGQPNQLLYSFTEAIDIINQETGKDFKFFLAKKNTANLPTYWARTSFLLHKILFYESNYTEFAGGAQYVIPRQNILHRPLDFYITLHMLIVKFANKSFAGDTDDLSKGVDAWTLEVLWNDIFNPALPLKNTALTDLHRLLLKIEQ